MQNEMKKGEIAGGLLFFFGLLDGLLVCWLIAACFGEKEEEEEEEEKEEEEEEEEEEEKQRKNGDVNCIVLTCLVFKLIRKKDLTCFLLVFFLAL